MTLDKFKYDEQQARLNAADEQEFHGHHDYGPPSMRYLVELAKTIATEAHAGQTRWGGEPYIVHPERVAAKMRANGYGPELEAIAWLHDVIEDTPVTASDLLAKGITQPIVDNVIALTHDKSVSYLDYILNVRRWPYAIEVKVADLQDNLTDSAGMKGKNTIRAKWKLSLWILRNTH